MEDPGGSYIEPSEDEGPPTGKVTPRIYGTTEEDELEENLETFIVGRRRRKKQRRAARERKEARHIFRDIRRQEQREDLQWGMHQYAQAGYLPAPLPQKRTWVEEDNVRVNEPSKGEGYFADDPPSDQDSTGGRSAVTRVTKNRVEEERTRAEMPSLGEGGSVEEQPADAP